MSNGRSGRIKGDRGRESGGFIALPWSVTDSPAYLGLSHPARSLLFELARQVVRDNNGRLLASRAFLAKRGWKSADVIDRAKRELLEAGFIAETVKGHRPNKASWYAVTWRLLDDHAGYDPGVRATFERGAYRQGQNARLSPAGGTGKASIGPSGGTGEGAAGPSGGPMAACFGGPSVPSGGHHLEMPSAVAEQMRAQGQAMAASGPANAAAVPGSGKRGRRHFQLISESVRG
jgi:hypothetical protein